jgi:tetratricopeptide (TPR) repeat protein
MRLLLNAGVLVCAVLCVVTACLAEDKTPDYSKEAAIIQEFGRDLVFSADGTWSCEQTAAIKVQSDAGVRAFGILAFDYDSENQSIEIEYVRVRTPGGNTVETPPDSVQDISSDVTRIAPTYSDLREKQIPVRGLSANSVLEYKVRLVQSKAIVPNEFWDLETFVTGAVVLRQTLRISVPAGKYVNIVSKGVTPEIQEEKGQKIYFWKAAQLTPTAQQANGKAAAEAPTVQLTTFKTWEAIGSWYGPLATARAVVTPAIQAKADELTKGLTTVQEKEKAIYDYVSTHFRYISISFGIGRYQPHAADDVLTYQYGDCKDKHTLLAALLKAAGIEAWAALIGDGIQFDNGVPSPAQFNHVITFLPDGASPVWLDTTPEIAPFGYLAPTLRDQQALVIPFSGPARLMKTPANPPFPTSENLVVDSTISDDGTLTGHFDYKLRGDGELLLRAAFHQAAAASWQELMQNIIAALGFAGKVSNVVVSNPEQTGEPLHISYDYRREDYTGWANGWITPPLFALLLPETGERQKPSDPILLKAPGTITFRSTTRLPKGYSAQPPNGVTLAAKFAIYRSSYRFANGVLSAERQLSILISRVQASEWDEYQKFAKQILDDHNNTVQVVAETTAAPALDAQADEARARELMQQAAQFLQQGRLDAARDAVSQAAGLSPNTRGLWWLRASLLFLSGKPDLALAAMQKEVDLHPDFIEAYRALAQGEMQFGKTERAIETLRGGLKANPGNVDLVASLASLLNDQKRYEEAADLLAPALQKSPDKENLQLAYITAALNSGKKEEGIAAARRLLEKSNSALSINNVARSLADSAADLKLAREYAEKAVLRLEEESKQTTLDNFDNKDLARVNALVAVWDTLGWTYYKSGDLVTAQKYMQAAWMLGQRGDIADHLGQLYDKAGKRDEAIHYWRLALADDSRLADVRQRLGPSRVAVAPPRNAGSPISLQEELGRQRAVVVPNLQARAGSAEFWILFSAKGAEDAQFISGSNELEAARLALLQAHYANFFPDNGPEKIVRRGILSCSQHTKPSCELVFLLPRDTHR